MSTISFETFSGSFSMFCNQENKSFVQNNFAKHALSVQDRKPTNPISSAFSGRYFSLPHPCAIRFPRSNGQILTSPISSAFSGRYFSLAAPMCHQIFKSNRQISTSPISSALDGEWYPGSFIFDESSRRLVGNSGGARRDRLHCLRGHPVEGNHRETRGHPFSVSRVASRYRQQQGDTWPSVLREPRRFPLNITTVVR